MAAVIVYQSDGRDGHRAGFCEVTVDSDADLVGLKVSVGNEQLDPAPGSSAYTPDLSHLFKVAPDGTWTEI